MPLPASPNRNATNAEASRQRTWLRLAHFAFFSLGLLPPFGEEPVNAFAGASKTAAHPRPDFGQYLSRGAQPEFAILHPRDYHASVFQTKKLPLLGGNAHAAVVGDPDER